MDKAVFAVICGILFCAPSFADETTAPGKGKRPAVKFGNQDIAKAIQNDKSKNVVVKTSTATSSPVAKAKSNAEKGTKEYK